MAFGLRSCEAGVRPPLDSVGDACASAPCDRFSEALIEGSYNVPRQLSTLDSLSPTASKNRKLVSV